MLLYHLTDKREAQPGGFFVFLLALPHDPIELLPNSVSRLRRNTEPSVFHRNTNGFSFERS